MRISKQAAAVTGSVAAVLAIGIGGAYAFTSGDSGSGSTPASGETTTVQQPAAVQTTTAPATTTAPSPTSITPSPVGQSTVSVTSAPATKETTVASEPKVETTEPKVTEGPNGGPLPKMAPPVDPPSLQPPPPANSLGGLATREP